MRDRVSADLVPKNFVEQASLPRDDRGRIDRSQLRDPFAEEDDYVAPRTPTEQAIASIWEDLLGLDRVSVHDNFLDVGGHSLVGIRTLVRIEKDTGVRLHANALTLQTLAQLADDIEKEGGGVADAPDSSAGAPGDGPPSGGQRQNGCCYAGRRGRCLEQFGVGRRVVCVPGAGCRCLSRFSPRWRCTTS